MNERLQKVIAARGIASRREAERMILDGRIAVNGAVVTELGTRVDPDTDRVEVDGRPLRAGADAPRVLMLNKPVGYLSTCKPDREIGPTVLELVPRDRRYFPVGRLDQNSSGLMLLTDDGDLAHRLTHPSFGTEKVYDVETRHPLRPEQVNELIEGVMLEDGPARAIDVEQVAPRGVLITLGEGRKRQIRRMIIAVGSRVLSLRRIRIGGLSLGSLPSGKWRELDPAEIALLLQPPPR
jgi:pseudouridine synthase